ncbi:MAG: DUF1801 domain-containing protein [Proteobacteria bacterium]|nr:DUF1801 domain-containing protein [Pseudomonadota bacterium]
MSESPKILRGGPEIPSGEGDPPVQAYIAALPGWRGDTCRRLDRVITRTVSGVRKAVKWNAPIYGAPVGRSWFLSITGYENFVRVAFFDGTMLKPPPPGPSRFEAIRYYDIPEGGIDEAEFAGWVEQAAALPGWTP